MKKVPMVSGVLLVSVCLGLGGSKTLHTPDVLNEKATPATSAPFRALPPSSPPGTSVVGNYTTLEGYYDYQINGGAAQHIRANPANGNLHAIYMATSDSPAVSGDPSRRTLYAFSTNGGATWNNFSNLQVPSRRSGFATLDLGTGPFAGAAVIANHSILAGSGNQATIFVDFPEGGGAFSEIGPPTGFGSDEAIWPFIASNSDGSVTMAASRQTAATNHYTSTSDFVSWTPLATYPGINSPGGRYPVHANGTGRVGVMLNAVLSGTFFLESTNNGVTWASSATEIVPATPPGRVAGVDTFQAWVGGDFVYNGNTPLFVCDQLAVGANEPDEGAAIAFFSTPTGWKTIANRANTTNVPRNRNIAQTNTFTIGYPAIGMSGTQIVVVYQAMQQETSAAHFNFIDIFATRSTDGGNSWSRPYNVTQTANLDERYPAISPWNESGFANVTWQEDAEPGSAAFTDLAPLSRARQKFLKLNLSLLAFTGVEQGGGSELVTGFKLAQNFPNPFNPATKIDYNVAKAGPVTIKVYDVLGKEVATLLNEELQPGSYQATFDGHSLASGVYIYKMVASGYTETRRMMLVK